MCGFALTESMVTPCGMESLFFPLAEKKTAIHGQKKELRDDLTQRCQIIQNGAARHALPTKSGSHLPAALYPNIKSAYPRI